METIKVLAKSIREYKKPSILTPVFILGEAVLETLMPLVMASLIEEIQYTTAMEPIIKYGLILLAMAFASLICGELAGRYAASASCGFAKNLRHDLYYKVQEFSFSDIDKFSTSSLVTRLTTDVTNVQNAYQMLIRIAIRVPLMFIFSFAVSFKISWKLSLIFVVAIPVLATGLIALIRVVMPFFIKIFRKYDAMNESVQENVQAIRVVKSYVREEHEKSKFDEVSNTVKNDFTKAEKLLALNNPLMYFVIYVVIALVVMFGSKMIANSHGMEITTGELSALISYAIHIMMALLMLSMIFVMSTMSAESAKRIKEVLTTDSSLKSPENGITTVDNGEIVFENVSFKYSEKAERNALDDINITIHSGETIGVIGGTGSSKTTFVQLIPRLYDVTEGSLKVAGRDVREYDLKTLRDAVSMVLQKNELFSGTIKDNVRWGNLEASDEEIVHACKLACADEYIETFPDKYDKKIEQGGTNVSGGQKQRLCIARALIKKPKILILDDSTSAVDTKTDAKIRKAFREELPDMTKIIIAQRVASVEDADRIIVMDGGKIVAFDTHDNLLKSNEIYRSVYESQTKHSDGGEN